jgi:hypothetical protein
MQHQASRQNRYSRYVQFFHEHILASDRHFCKLALSPQELEG